eukprot:486549_1
MSLMSDHCVWKLGSITPTRSILLCHGYIRNESLTSNVPNSIKDTCINYFEQKTAFNFINDRKNIGKFITSKIFVVRGFKWMFKLIPNRFNLTENKCRLYILLVSLPPKIRIFTANFVISLINTHIKIEFCNRLNLYRQRTYRPSRFNLNILKSLQSPEFKIEINLVNVQLDYSESDIANYHRMLDVTNKQNTCHFQWIIDDIAKYGTRKIHSKIFLMHSFEWYLYIRRGQLYINSHIPIECICLVYNIKLATQQDSFEFCDCLSLHHFDMPKKK